MSWGKKLLNKIENTLETALAKLDKDDPKGEVKAPPTEGPDFTLEELQKLHEMYEDPTHIPPMADKIAEVVLSRLGAGNSITAGVKPIKLESQCPVCGQKRTDALLAGLNEEYLDFSGEFNEKRFRDSLTCRRCGMGFGDNPEKLIKAREEWIKLSHNAESEDDIRKNAEKATREATKAMYDFSTADDSKEEEGC